VSVLEDLNSTNGVVIRGQRVRRYTLHHGDVISLGQHEMLYVDETAAHHLTDTHDDLPRLDADADAANEEADDDSVEDAARAR
jgi:hypothetical protein